MKQVLMLIQIDHSKRKLAWKFFFACLKPWGSKNSAISAADRNSWKFQARHIFLRAFTKHPQQWPHLKILEQEEREVNVATHCECCWWSLCAFRISLTSILAIETEDSCSNTLALSQEKVWALRAEIKSMRDREAGRTGPGPTDENGRGLTWAQILHHTWLKMLPIF